MRKYVYHPNHVVQYPLDVFREDLSCEEEAEAILAREERVLRKNTIPFLKFYGKIMMFGKLLGKPRIQFTQDIRTSSNQPLWGFLRGDTVVGSTKHAWDWSYHGVTPKEFTDIVVGPDLERIKLMGAQSLTSASRAWKKASNNADNALRRQQRNYASLERKMKRKEEELGEANAETGWDTALGTVNEACPDFNPTNYVCPDDEALLQRFRTRVFVSDRIPQDPILPPPESSSRLSTDDHSSSSSKTETTETSSESEGMMTWMPRAPPLLRVLLALRGLFIFILSS
ncbi:hypothetical protein AgCh_022572 [Apium graveolens]